jgi:CotH kinase protein
VASDSTRGDRKRRLATRAVARRPRGTDTRHRAQHVRGTKRRSLCTFLSAGGLLACQAAGPVDSRSGLGAPPPFESVFGADHLPVFELSLPESSTASLAADPFTYQPAHFRYRPDQDPGRTIVLPYVGLRLKGRASFHPIDGKPALKIKFDKYIKSQRFLGLRRLTLNNMEQDPSMVRERLSYHVFRQAGLIAPMCNSARVVVNGDYYGLYANVQTIDRTFLETHFDPARGNLYDISSDADPIDLQPGSKSSFQLETNRAENRTSDLDALLEAVGGQSADFVGGAASIVDLDQWLAVGAVQAVIADWDGYFGGMNNYELYHDVGRGRFVLLPWGCDQTFGIINGQFKFVTYRIDGARTAVNNGLLFRRCRQSRNCYERYLTQVERALTVWERLDLTAELDGILTQIRPSVFEDRRRAHSIEEFEQSVKDVRVFLSRRGRIVRRQLERLRVRLDRDRPQDGSRIR